MGDGADDADGFFTKQRDLAEIRELLFGQQGKSRARRVALKERYDANSAGSVGMKLRCCVCNTLFTKKQLAQKFCNVKTKGKSSCKDFYHNFTTEERRIRQEIHNK